MVQELIQAITDLDNHLNTNDYKFKQADGLETRQQENREIVRSLSRLHFGEEPNLRELLGKLLVLQQWLEKEPELRQPNVEANGLTVLKRIKAATARAQQIGAFQIASNNSFISH